jgi:LysR family transcriptional regulator, glycine cleavage system transcriptional activator
MAANGLPPLGWLRAFEAAGRTLSFTEAAREIGVTQAAISKNIKLLELSVRQPLFHRHARSLELTKSGEAYLPKVQDALERLAIGTREVFGHRQSGALTVRCATSFAVNWLAPRLPGFFERHPKTPLRLLSSVWSDAFDPQAFDFDIQYGHGRWPGVTSKRLTREAITPLCAPAIAARLRHPEDLRSERLLHVLGYQEGWGNWIKAAGLAAQDMQTGLQLDTSLMAFELAANAVGVALGRTSLSAPERQSGRLVAPFPLQVEISEGFHLLERQDGSAHPDAAIFAAWLMASIEADLVINQRESQ